MVVYLFSYLNWPLELFLSFFQTLVIYTLDILDQITHARELSSFRKTVKQTMCFLAPVHCHIWQQIHKLLANIRFRKLCVTSLNIDAQLGNEVQQNLQLQDISRGLGIYQK